MKSGEKLLSFLHRLFRVGEQGMPKKWVYKLVCSNPECRHAEISEFNWETCSICGAKYIIVNRWHGGN